MTIKGKLTNQQVGAMGINRTDNGQNKHDECQIEKNKKEDKNRGCRTKKIVRQLFCVKKINLPLGRVKDLW